MVGIAEGRRSLSAGRRQNRRSLWPFRGGVSGHTDRGEPPYASSKPFVRSHEKTPRSRARLVEVIPLERWFRRCSTVSSINLPLGFLLYYHPFDPFLSREKSPAQSARSLRFRRRESLPIRSSEYIGCFRIENIRELTLLCAKIWWTKFSSYVSVTKFISYQNEFVRIFLKLFLGFIIVFASQIIIWDL